MQIQLLSDLHLEQDTDAIVLPPIPSDLVILAGDTHQGKTGVEWAKAQYVDRPVLYLLGNHEYDWQTFATLAAQLREEARGSNVHVLERDSFEFDGVHFLGCTLWTDFDICGTRDISMAVAQAGAGDYRRIYLDGEDVPADQRRFIVPEDTRLLHHDSRKWLEDQVAASDAANTIVITHHAPSMLSIRDDYKTSEYVPAVASAFDEFISRSGLPYWLHGHIHQRADYKIGTTQILANPRGYPDERPGLFDPTQTINL